MALENTDVAKPVLNAQQPYWESKFSTRQDMFGRNPSPPAPRAANLFKQESKTKILELGCGQGRDTIFFAQNGFRVYAVDYTQSGVDAINQKARALGLDESITAVCHDVRNPLPFEDNSFDGCYSHMLYCMALTTSELEFLSNEVRRVLKPGGLNVYTVRNANDPHYRTGIPRGEDMYEVNGFIVHFFSQEKVTHLAKGYEIFEIDEFEEGDLPRKLYRVTLRKK